MALARQPTACEVPVTTRLHWFWSTNPQKIRWALEELGLDYELERVDLVRREHRRPAYAEIHPRAKVPALEIDDVVLWESGAALLYLGQREGRLWPSSPEARAAALNLLFLESAAWQEQASVHFYNRVVLPFAGAATDPDRLAKAAKKIEPLCSLLARQLGDADYLLGDFSLVDCAYGPWLPVVDLEAFPSLVAWRARLMARPAWAACEFTYG